MDAAVALVQAYLRLNGYFTETEYPIVSMDHGRSMTLTDVDILALRFPHAGRWIPSTGQTLPVDPILDTSTDRMDMIIGEVKERHCRLNRAAYTLPVIETVLRRFGCCEEPRATAEAVLRGERRCTHAGPVAHCRIRIVVFSGNEAEVKSSHFDTISLGHVARYLGSYISQNSEIFLHTLQKDNVLGFVSLLLKLGIEI